jgi:glycosyltransferase involved in cell wall biosynthesis
VGDGPLAGELRERAGALGLGERIHFLGRRANDAVPGVAAAADAFITASVTEGHPITVIEALAAGCPVLAFSAPGIGETVEHGRNGLLASAEDPAALGQVLVQLAEAPDLRQRLSAGARQSAQQYDIRLTTRRIQDHYEQLLKARRPASG